MKVLVADDDLISRTVLTRMLTSWGYEVVAAVNGDEAWQMLQAEAGPELAILDWVMPGLDGRQVCQAVRNRSGERYIYLVLVTGKSSQGDLIQGLEAGADDYLVKPYDPLELKMRLIAGRRIIDLQRELIAAREAMRFQATRDFLTGVWNHRAIMEIMERELSRGVRQGSPVGVIMTDLDHFKLVNDTYGHLAGDAVLVEAARRMSGTVRPYDHFGRYGGEEFLILVPGSNQSNTVKLAERMRQNLSAEPIVYEQQRIVVTASFGVAAFGGIPPARSHTLLHEADTALYRAKRGGRNRVATLT